MTMTVTRRAFVTTGLSMLAMPAIIGQAMAHGTGEPEGWVFPPEYEPIVVRLRDRLEPGQIHVDPNTRNLYWTLENRQALRFKVGVGRGDLYEPGTFTVGAKKEWPSWTPTKEMIDRDPDSYARWADGMPGGPDNPLGARALYLFNDAGADTFLRIHGTPQPWTVGSAVSNGCVRLKNEHAIQLYDLCPQGTKVVLYPKRSGEA